MNNLLHAVIRRRMFFSDICTVYSLHDYCEHLIAPGTLGHIAQKTLHLAATNSTTGEHHNTNSSSPQTPIPDQGPTLERPLFPWAG